MNALVDVIATLSGPCSERRIEVAASDVSGVFVWSMHAVFHPGR
jgi:hypothetical protein